jgi:hypothetical protein
VRSARAGREVGGTARAIPRLAVLALSKSLEYSQPEIK